MIRIGYRSNKSVLIEVFFLFVKYVVKKEKSEDILGVVKVNVEKLLNCVGSV